MKTNKIDVKLKNPNDLVCGFNLSKQIHELGISLNTFFYYLYFPNTGKRFLYRNKTAGKTYDYNLSRGIHCELIPAPLSEELLLGIPHKVQSWCNYPGQRPKNVIYCSSNIPSGSEKVVSGNNEATARAKMLLHLYETGAIDLK